MKLEFNENELENLMKDFYLLTGIRIVLFDTAYQELFSYPKHHCAFCQNMKSGKDTRKLCEESDQASFERCKLEGRLILSRCHAGLIEATAPLIDHNTIIGYMMFGQISDDPNRAYTPDIPLKTTEQVAAAAKIMEACTFYVLMKNTISARRDNFVTNMDRYLMEHLTDDLSIEGISLALGISKSKLYQNFNKYYDCGISEHIRMLRIEKAKKLLADSDLSVTEISDAVGFSDYNYFCRVFKKEAGIPAKKYRQHLQNTWQV